MQKFKFSYDDIKQISKSIIILIDKREKVNSHITDYFDKHKIPYQKQTLDFGDYSFLLPAAGPIPQDSYFHKDIVIERKNSLEELSGSLGKERDRFEKEFLKAKSNDCKIHLLVENPRGYNDIMEHQYDTAFKPLAYISSLKSWENRYDIKTQFVDKQYSGYIIWSTFYYYLREALH